MSELLYRPEQRIDLERLLEDRLPAAAISERYRRDRDLPRPWMARRWYKEPDLDV
jgi:hypothetical protein